MEVVVVEPVAYALQHFDPVEVRRWMTRSSCILMSGKPAVVQQRTRKGVSQYHRVNYSDVFSFIRACIKTIYGYVGEMIREGTTSHMLTKGELVLLEETSQNLRQAIDAMRRLALQGHRSEVELDTARSGLQKSVAEFGNATNEHKKRMLSRITLISRLAPRETRFRIAPDIFISLEEASTDNAKRFLEIIDRREGVQVRMECAIKIALENERALLAAYDGFGRLGARANVTDDLGELRIITIEANRFLDRINDLVLVEPYLSIHTQYVSHRDVQCIGKLSAYIDGGKIQTYRNAFVRAHRKLQRFAIEQTASAYSAFIEQEGLNGPND